VINFSGIVSVVVGPAINNETSTESALLNKSNDDTTLAVRGAESTPPVSVSATLAANRLYDAVDVVALPHVEVFAGCPPHHIYFDFLFNTSL